MALVAEGTVPCTYGQEKKNNPTNNTTMPVGLSRGIVASSGMARVQAGDVPAQRFLYDTINGSSGYLDRTYSVNGVLSPSANSAGTALSGGTGMLSNGVVAKRPWFNTTTGTSNADDWVGWSNRASVTVTFSLPAPYSTVLIHVSNEQGVTGIYGPSFVKVNGVTRTSTTTVATGTIGWLTYTGLSLAAGGQCVIEIGIVSGTFLFVSEIFFQ